MAKYSTLSVFQALYHGALVFAEEPLRCIYVNPCLQQWIQRNEGELRENALELVFSDSSLARVRDLIEDVQGSSVPLEATGIELRAPEERYRLVDVRACQFELPDGPAIALLLGGAASPVADPMANGRHDSLTGLFDREFAMHHIGTLLSGVRAADREFAVLFIDLDNFKQVNDAHGHLLGDRVLREAARRLAGCVREHDFVARFGGDEFLVFVDRVTQPADIRPVIERIHAAITPPIALPGGSVVLSLSIGSALASPAHHSAEDLIADADRAMYAAKRASV